MDILIFEYRLLTTHSQAPDILSPGLYATSYHHGITAYTCHRAFEKRKRLALVSLQVDLPSQDIFYDFI